MANFDGLSDFKSLDRRIVRGGTPGDIAASALIRNQEYWLQRHGAAVSFARPRQEQDRWASYEWRVLTQVRMPLRTGVKKITFSLDMNVGYGGGGSAPNLEVRLSIPGVGEAVQLLGTGDYMRTITLELDEALPYPVPAARIVLEFRSDVSDIEPVLDGGSGGTQVQGRRTEYGELRGNVSAYPDPVPGTPDEVFVTLVEEDGATVADEVIELCGPDGKISTPTAFNYPLVRPGDGSDVDLAMGYLTYFEFRGGQLMITYEPEGSDSTFIEYPLTRMAPRQAVRGQDVSIHGHNATGLYARAPQLRTFALPGATHATAEESVNTRWTALRTQYSGTEQAADIRYAVDINAENPRLCVSLDFLAFYLPSAGTRRRTPESLTGEVSITVRLSQYSSGVSPAVRGSQSRTHLVEFFNPVAAEMPDMMHVLAKMFRGSELGVAEGVDWRDGLATLDELLLADSLDFEFDTSGFDPSVPALLHVEFEQLEPLPGAPGTASCWVLPVQCAAWCLRQPFDNGAPSANNKRLATGYAGFAPLDTALGEGVDHEDWESWIELNHLTWAHLGWVCAGPDALYVDSASFFVPPEAERWQATFIPVRKTGGAHAFRAAMYARDAEVRFTLTTSPGGSSTTVLLTQSSSTPGWVEVEQAIPDDTTRLVTIEVRTTGTDGWIYCMATREPQAEEADL